MKASVIALAAAAVLAAPASAQEGVANFYRGKSIQLIIPSSAGGGYDLYGRLVGRHIGKFIPGNPAVTPQNMGGAAGVVAAQYVYSAGVKDGTVLGEVYPNAIMEPLTGDKTKIKYDSLKFNYIGSANAESFICYVGGSSPIKSFAEAFEKEVILGASGVGGPSTERPNMYNNLLGTKFRIVNGYPGITEIGLAIEKGEVHGTCGSSWATMTTGRPDWLPSGAMRLIAEENLRPHPDIAKYNVPLTPSFAKTDDAKKIFDFVFTQADFGRPFLMAPEVPADRVQAMRAAFAATLKDEAFLAEAAKLRLEISGTLTGEQLQAIVARLMATPADVVAKVKEAVETKK